MNRITSVRRTPIGLVGGTFRTLPSAAVQQVFAVPAATLLLARWIRENSPESAMQSCPGCALQCGHSTESGLIGGADGMASFGMCAPSAFRAFK